VNPLRRSPYVILEIGLHLAYLASGYMLVTSEK